MNHEETIRIAAPRQRVWDVLVDVARWPEWTESMTRVQPVTPGPLAVGSEVRIKQPRLAATLMRVTALDPGRSFTWAAHSPGLTTEADHVLEPAGDGTTVTLRLRQRGPLAGLFSLLAGARFRRYVRMEAEGLKVRSEA